MKDKIAIQFEYTSAAIQATLANYLRTFSAKVELFGHQVADFTEAVSASPGLLARFGENGPTNLQYCLDRFMMSVLKGFLQSVDEGFADIIDELEDSCSGEPEVAEELKKAILKFQQLSFEKRQTLTAEHVSSKQEMNKNSLEWFDNFFGDVTTLLKNPLTPSSSSKGLAQKPQLPLFEHTGTVSPESFGEWRQNKVACQLPMTINYKPHASVKGSATGKDDCGSSFGEIPLDRFRETNSNRNASPDFSGAVSWKKPHSVIDVADSVSHTKTPSSASKIRRISVDLRKEDLQFDELFSRESFDIDGSSRLRSFSRLRSACGESK